MQTYSNTLQADFSAAANCEHDRLMNLKPVKMQSPICHTETKTYLNIIAPFIITHKNQNHFLNNVV